MANKGKIAIIGMACLFPSAPNLSAFWSNIVRGVDAIRDVSSQEWEEGDYYDKDATSFGKNYSKRGGFISDISKFDPLKFGIMPTSLRGSDPDQFLTLKVAHEALADAGYLEKPFNRDRAEVIIGRISAPGTGSMNLIQQTKTVSEIERILHALLPEDSRHLADEIVDQVKDCLQPCTSDNVPGAMPNVLAGRVAAKLGFRGRNLLVDAACASSMVAIETAVNDLLSGTCDLALAGGVHINASPVFFQLFCVLGALSRADVIRPFDENADGTLLGEGVGMICLKRHEDAVRDGDRIYATICGVGSSSDGFGGSVIAPSLEGEALAIQRAYEMAGVEPSSVELLEAHGTATPTGDVIELQAVEKVFGSGEPHIALGTIKSMIGHAQSASAVAGVIKAALSLYHRVLPPTLNVETPTKKIDWKAHPCYINKEARPWLKSEQQKTPRRAGVSAFGFGGINAHVVLEEAGATVDSDTSLLHRWDSEILTFGARTKDELVQRVQAAQRSLQSSAPTAKPLKDVAAALNCGREQPELQYRAAVVATDSDDAEAKLARLVELIEQTDNVNESERGLFYASPAARVEGKLAFVYPGLGSAYTNMLRDLCLHFPEVRQVFESVDSIAKRAGAKIAPSELIFPHPQTQEESAASTSLAEADFAVVAVLLATYAIHELLKHVGVQPDAVLGCSTGEFAAVTTSGAVEVLSAAENFYRMSTKVARSIPADKLVDLRSLRVFASWERVKTIAGALEIYLTADLDKDHVMVTGDKTSIEALSEKLREERVLLQTLPSAIPYHTPLVHNLIDDSASTDVDIQALSIPAWSCATAAKLPEDTEELRASFTRLFTKPILLQQTVQAMYADGVRHFVEVGPNGVLTVLVNSILHKQPHIAVASNLASKSGITQLHSLLGALFVNGIDVRFDYLYERRKSGTQSSDREVLLPLVHPPLKVDPTRLSGSVQIESARSDENDPEVDVMQSFLQTNASFFSQINQVHDQVMRSFMDVAPSDEENYEDIAIYDNYAFLSRFDVQAYDEFTEVHLPISLHTDLYLLDHAIGGFIATSPAKRVYLMPLMVAIEIMAQAGFAHAGGGIVMRLEQVKALRRIVVDHDGLTLRLRVTGHDEKVHVELFQPDDTAQPSMALDVIFGLEFEPTPAPRLKCNGKAAKNLTSQERLYSPTTMFHGPRMQSVELIESVEKRTISGIAQARTATGWFPDEPAPRFLVDPLLLDNSSQFVLFHLYEHELEATALLPFFIESIDFYGQPEHLSDHVQVIADLNTLTEKATAADVEIYDSDGALWARVNNINSRRVALDPRWKQFVADPCATYLTTPISTEFGGTAVSFVKDDILPKDETVLEWCLDYLLTETERSYWRVRAKTDKRKHDWLLGRIAAKEAVRRLVKDAFDLQLGPCDVEITYNDDNAPLVELLGSHGTKCGDISISISHSGKMAVAAASTAGDTGVDIQVVQPIDAGLAKTFLTPGEQKQFAENPLAHEHWIAVWSAKEALFKATVGTIEMQRFELCANAPSSLQFRYGDRSFSVQTQIVENAVLSLVLLQRAPQAI